MTKLLRVSATFIFTLYFSVHSYSEDLSSNKGELGYSDQSREPPANAVFNTTPQQPLTSKQAQLRMLNAEVLQDYELDHGSGIKFRGTNLGQVNRDIDPVDAIAIEAEVRRLMKDLNEVVGDIEGLVLGEFLIVALDGREKDSQNFLVKFKQFVHGAPVGRATLGVTADKLTLVDTHFVDTTQKSLQKELWASEKQVKEAAIQALRLHDGIEELDMSLIRGPRLTFQIIDANDTTEPWYLFLYPGYAVHVSALTLESIVRSTIVNAAPTDLQTI